MDGPHPPLSDALATYVLVHLGVTRESVSVDVHGVGRLIDAYVRRVPWESASRIARCGGRDAAPTVARDPEAFWDDAVQLGTGGTCFESNDAFLALLHALGFSGVLTINDMGTTCACHTAIILDLDGQRWLVDVGLPVYAIVPLNSSMATSTTSTFHTYTATPTDDSRWEITRTNHPKVSCFTLIGIEVPTSDYRDASTRDYGPDGLFLDRVIVAKVVDGLQWRFNGGERPWCLERFERGQRFTEGLEQLHDPAERIATHFDMDGRLVREAIDRCPPHADTD